MKTHFEHPSKSVPELIAELRQTLASTRGSITDDTKLNSMFSADNYLAYQADKHEAAKAMGVATMTTVELSNDVNAYWPELAQVLR